MYQAHFDLRDLPFKVTPDPAFIHWDRQHQRAACILEMGIAQLAPLSVLTGDVGTGKTTMLLHILGSKPEGVTIGLISSFCSGYGNLFQWVLNAFEIPQETDEIECFEAFQDFALAEFAAGRRCALIVDEAQNLSDSDLEKLRMLTNMNSGKDVLLMLFLVGQQQLREQLKKPSNRQIAQRAGPTYHLGPMTLADTKSYIEHRIAVAGGTRTIFDDDAIAVIHAQTGGVPRLVNVVCDMAMVSAYGEDLALIDGDFMRGFLQEARQSGLLAHLPTQATVPAIEEHVAPHPLEARPISDADAEPVPDVEAERAVVSEIKPEEPEPASVVNPPVLKLVDPLPDSKPSEQPSDVRRKLMMGTAAAAMSAAILFAINVDSATDGAPVELAGLVIAPKFGSERPAPDSTSITLPESITLLEDVTGAALLERALDLGVTDPKAAAIAYARAALRGESRAAYYLGQHYETGDGVARDFARARAWYMSAQDSARGAERRLAELAPPEQSGEMTPPVPLLGGPLADGGAEFVWTSGQGVDPAYFVVELSADPEGSVTRLAALDVSALRVETVGEALIWRVLAVDPVAGGYTVSDWVPLGDTVDPAPLGVGPVDPEVTVVASVLNPVTRALEAENIAYKTVAGTPLNAAGQRVQYYFDADKDAAQQIATLLGITAEKVTYDMDAPRPLPGQIMVLPEPR